MMGADRIVEYVRSSVRRGAQTNCQDLEVSIVAGRYSTPLGHKNPGACDKTAQAIHEVSFKGSSTSSGEKIVG